MTADHKRSDRHWDYLQPADLRRLANPLDYIADDHLRERTVCAMLDRIAVGDEDDQAFEQVRWFLDRELPLHLQDEEEDLFPMMRRRCEPVDEIDAVIERLRAEHRHAQTDTPEIVGIIDDAMVGAGAVSAADRAALSSFAAHARRHLIVENAIILPIARARLTGDDLKNLRLRMLQRRGLRLPLGDDHV